MRPSSLAVAETLRNCVIVLKGRLVLFSGKTTCVPAQQTRLFARSVPKGFLLNPCQRRVFALSATGTFLLNDVLNTLDPHKIVELGTNVRTGPYRFCVIQLRPDPVSQFALNLDAAHAVSCGKFSESGQGGEAGRAENTTANCNWLARLK